MYAVYATGFQFEKTTFELNEARTGSGGAINYFATASPGTLLAFHSCTFDSNSAEQNGGAVLLAINPVQSGKNAPSAVAPAVVSLFSTTFASNKAGPRGGAIDASFPPNQPTNLRFKHANCSSVPLCTQPDDITDNIQPGLFAENTARTWNRSVVLRLDNVSFAGNTAGTNADGAGNGGALAVTNGAVETVSVTSTSNTAGQYGGAFYLDGTASLHSTESTWRNNALRRPGADGQHIYAAAGAGEWRFAGNTKFDHAAAGTSGLAAAQIDGVVGLDSASVRVSCPPGCVQSEKSEWVDPFLATSDDWSLGEGQAVTTTTNWIFAREGRPQRSEQNHRPTKVSACAYIIATSVLAVINVAPRYWSWFSGDQSFSNIFDILVKPLKCSGSLEGEATGL